MNKFLKYMALAAAVAGVSQVAHATASLRISDGVSTITVSDNGAGDINGAVGVVVWNGSIGVWTINVDTGITKPAQGSAANPFLDLNFVDVSNAPGTLTLQFTETDFTGIGSALALIGGTTAGTVSYATYWSASNAQFATTTPLTAQGPFGPGSFSQTVSGGSVTAGPYSLTQVITITHASGGTSSGDAELRIPDSGTSILLLGASLTGLGLVGRWRKRLA